jgi:hypothetical protein
MYPVAHEMTLWTEIHIKLFNSILLLDFEIETLFSMIRRFVLFQMNRLALLRLCGAS